MKLTDKRIIEALRNGRRVLRKSYQPYWIWKEQEGDCRFLRSTGCSPTENLLLDITLLSADDWEVGE